MSIVTVYNHLKNDWGKIRNEFMKLPDFEDAIKLCIEGNTINSTGYSLIIQNDSFMINWESDFGKKSCKRFSSITDLETFLFSEQIDRYLDRELKEISIENIFLSNVIRGNLKYAMWNNVSTEIAKEIVDSLNFSLRVSLIQLTNDNNYLIKDNEKYKYVYCANNNYKFVITKCDNEFIVDFRKYRYAVSVNNDYNY